MGPYGCTSVPLSHDRCESYQTREIDHQSSSVIDHRPLPVLLRPLLACGSVQESVSPSSEHLFVSVYCLCMSSSTIFVLPVRLPLVSQVLFLHPKYVSIVNPKPQCIAPIWFNIVTNTAVNFSCCLDFKSGWHWSNTILVRFEEVKPSNWSFGCG